MFTLNQLMRLHGYGYYHPMELKEFEGFGDVRTHFYDNMHYNLVVRRIGAPQIWALQFYQMELIGHFS